jgi:putative GTP pyrophosphokinase
VNKQDYLRESYDNVTPEARNFSEALKDQLSVLLRQNTLSPAVPIESRIKLWPSILSKLDRLGEQWKDVREIWDLIGLRLIFLFPEETARACSLIDQNFDVLYRSNEGQKHSTNEFGYQSIHFTIRPLKKWLQVPTFRNHTGFQAEIQVRTLSQHNWAVASRLLQYNNQEYAPPSVQRSMYRVAALLEVVDLELDRVQRLREHYKQQLSSSSYSEELNVDLLESLLEAHMPHSHGVDGDDYAGLMIDLNKVKITTGHQVISLIDKHLPQALSNDAAVVSAIRSGDTSFEIDRQRLRKGVFYSHVGLMQNILNLEFGLAWRKHPRLTKSQQKIKRK